VDNHFSQFPEQTGFVRQFKFSSFIFLPQQRARDQHHSKCTYIIRVHFAEQFALPEENAWKNDHHLDPGIASIQEPLGNAVQTVLPKEHVEDIAGKNVAVLGTGPIGLMAIAVLRELGAARIFATAGGLNKIRMDWRRKWARIRF
jgi:threonine dehydrogenase-like Zn-dependent dehydrogenase